MPKQNKESAMNTQARKITSTFIEEDQIDGITRRWFVVDGFCYLTNSTFDNEEYALCSDGTILNGDACPLTPGDNDTIALEHVLY